MPTLGGAGSPIHRLPRVSFRESFTPGVGEYDTHTYGPSPTGGLNYGRVLGAEAIMHRHGLRTGVMMNAFADRSLDCSAAFARCSASAALRTLEYTQGYMRLPSRLSEHAVLEQWQPHPNTTGPASLPYSGMWMASAGAAAVRPSLVL